MSKDKKHDVSHIFSLLIAVCISATGIAIYYKNEYDELEINRNYYKNALDELEIKRKEELQSMTNLLMDTIEYERKRKEERGWR